MQKKSLIALLVVPFLLLCSFGFKTIKGNGHLISRNFDNKNFTDIAVSGNMKVYLKQGSTYSVKITAEENIMDLLEVKTEGQKIKLGFRAGNVSIQTSKEITVFITAPEFLGLEAGGNCSYLSQGALSASAPLSLSLTGASAATLEVAVSAVNVNINGAGNAKLTGKSGTLTIDGSGSSNINTSGMPVKKATVHSSGNCHAQVNALETLSVKSSGNADISYKGNPVIKKELYGSASLRQSK